MEELFGLSFPEARDCCPLGLVILPTALFFFDRDIVPHIPLCIDPACSGEIGGPYQHGIEIFYDVINMNISSPYKVCQGSPHNEVVTLDGGIRKLGEN